MVHEDGCTASNVRESSACPRVTCIWIRITVISNDLLLKEVRDAAYQEFASPPGPEEANIHQFGTPCTSLTDLMLMNGGTRTFDNPLGDGTLLCTLHAAVAHAGSSA